MDYLTLDATAVLPRCAKEHCGSQVNVAKENGARPPQSKCDIWMLVEDAIGWTFASAHDSLSGLDSLRITKLRSAVRRHLGVAISRPDILQCNTLQELIASLGNRSSEATACEEECDAATGGQEHAVWHMMWKGKCTWVVQRDRPLEEGVLRIALAGLMARHPALRVQRRDPASLYGEFQQTLTVLAHLRTVVRAVAPYQCVASVLQTLGDCMKRAWPRVAASCDVVDPAKVPLSVLPLEDSLEDAKHALWRCGSFVPPFCVTLAPVGARLASSVDVQRCTQALVQFHVTHMTSDGFSVVPLLSDFTHFVAVAEGRDPVPKALSPLPNMLRLLEERMHRTVDHDVSLADTVTLNELHGGVICRRTKHSREAAAMLVDVPAVVVAALKNSASEVYGCTHDILLLTALAVVLARLDDSKLVTLSLVANQRDEARASDMVGFFADCRELDIAVGRELGYVGVAVGVNDTVQQRQWRAPGLVGGDVVSVNFQWTDFDSREGFQQLPDFHYAQQRNRVRCPLEVYVDEPAPGQWRFALNFDVVLFSAARRCQFKRELTTTFQQMLAAPFASVWPKPMRCSPGSSRPLSGDISVRRVIGGCGWVVHGLAFVLSDGTRCGTFLHDDGSCVDLYDDQAMQDRGGVWSELAAGERIIAVHGRDSNFGYLAGEIRLLTSAGREIVYAGHKKQKFAEAFAFEAPHESHVLAVEFDVGSGRCKGILTPTGCFP